MLTFYLFELALDLFSADLRITNSCLDSRSATFGDMPQIVGDLFQFPTSSSCSMPEIVTQIVKMALHPLELNRGFSTAQTTFIHSVLEWAARRLLRYSLLKYLHFFTR